MLGGIKMVWLYYVIHEYFLGDAILGLLIITIVLNIIMVICNCLRTKKKEEINRNPSIPIINGSLIIASMAIIILYEFLEYKYSIILMGNVIIIVRYIIYLILIFTVSYGIFMYKKYEKVMSVWIKAVYHIGIIFLIVLALYKYIINMQIISHDVLM